MNSPTLSRGKSDGIKTLCSCNPTFLCRWLTPSTPIEQVASCEVHFGMRRDWTSVQAEAVEREEEVIMLEGSNSLIYASFPQRSYTSLKRSADGTLMPQKNNLVAFAKSYFLSSFSTSTELASDCNNNDRTEWKAKGWKQSYHDWQLIGVAAEGDGHE